MTRKTSALGCVLAVLASVAHGVTINFDSDSFGVTLVAPPIFDQTSPLTSLYAPLGVTFSGPAAGQGGAILDTDSNFGIEPRSGRNFLAFNNFLAYPRDPESIFFATPASEVSIWASGGNEDASFVMNAYDAVNTLVASSTVDSAARAFAELAVSYAPGIASVTLAQIGSDDDWVYDDLSFTPIPEPSSALLLMGLATKAGWRRRK